VVAGGYGSTGGFISNTLGLTTPADEIDNSALANPIVFDDETSGEGGTDTSNLLFDPNISLDEPAEAPASSETAPATDSQ
jgi:hypothetical protein